jgi:predicted permease
MWQDVRHAARAFLKSPGFTAIAVLSIAFGTGANVAVFSAADALILRPLPIPHASQLYTVGSQVRGGLATATGASYLDYLDIRHRTQTFAGLAAFSSRRIGFSARPDAPPRLKIATLVSDNFFQVLGIAPHLGRDFLPEENRVPGRDAVAILSYGLWQQEFGGDAAIVGHTIRIAGIDFTVVGVTPQAFTGVEVRFIREAVYIPLAMWTKLLNRAVVDPLVRRDERALTLKGRLKTGVSLSDARAELAVIAQDLERAYPETNERQTLTAITEMESKFERNPLDGWLLVILSTLSAAVLTVACANVAALLASRAPQRAREIAMRLAIGASRGRLVRQLIIESLAIALVGAIGGIAIGYAGILMLRQIELPTDVISVPVMQLDERTLLFSLAIAVTSAFLFGMGPALQTTRVDLVTSLKATDVSPSKRQRLAGRNILVALQISLSLVLLTIALYAFQSFRQEFADGPGFRTTRMAKLSVDTNQARYELRRSTQFFERALANIRELPGVESATAVTVMPLFGLEFASVVPEGYRLPEGEKSVRPLTSSIDEQYFDTMQIPVLAGRGFLPSDDDDAPPVAIVNEVFARHYWPSEDAIGKRFNLVDARGPWVEIVGVVNTTKYGYAGEPPQEFVYFPYRQQPRGIMVLLVATSGESASVIPALREVVRKLDSDVPAFDAYTMETFYAARATTIGNTLIMMIGGMGVMGMTLTMVGLYGLVSFGVSRRTRELGIRIAIGASYRRVLLMILRQGMTPAWFGLAAGVVLSVATMRVLPTLIPFNYSPNPRVFLIVLPLLFLITALAAFVPARRAARVDPTVALRSD